MCDYGHTYDRHYAECYAYLCSRRTVLQRRLLSRALPTASLNGITGTWSPAIDNTMPLSTRSPLMQVSVRLRHTIVVRRMLRLRFAAVGPFCHGATISALPTTSLNGVHRYLEPGYRQCRHHSLHVHP
ncbi:MAG: hypothetical protein MZV63_59075 [Marinilabiliales bacterium]|nr:hypothetical protein [Marinilabiliales bacterium]